MTWHILDFLEGDLPSKVWIRQHLDHADASECLFWPWSLAQTGYAQITKRALLVHRLMCEYRHGPAPTKAHHAAHSCGRGHEGCVNPMHLSWKTPSENQRDRFDGQPIAPQVKLTQNDVDQIRALEGIEKTPVIASRFGVSERNIRMIHKGLTWRRAKPWHRRFSEEEVATIRSTPWQVKSARAFAKEFDVTMSVIERIRTGKTHAYFPVSQQRDTEGTGR